MSSYLEVDELMREADTLPYGPVKMSVMQQAVRAADETHDLDCMFYTRIKLVCAATFSGAGEQSLVAFSWCLNQYKKDPQQFADYEYELCWEFKHVHDSILQFPQVSAEQIEALLDDMQAVYSMHNYSMRMVNNRRYCWEKERGNKQAAIAYFEKFQSDPRDGMADCIACDRNTEVRFYRYIGNHQRAIDHAQPLFRKELTCECVPRTTYSTILPSYAQTQRLDEADQLREIGYREIRDNPNYLKEIGHQLSYLSFRGQLKVGAKMFARHVEWALNSFELGAKFAFLHGAKWLFEELIAEISKPPKPQPKLKLNLPQSFPLYQQDGVYDANEILDWVNAEAGDLAARFDKRNKTTRYAEMLANYRYAFA